MGVSFASAINVKLEDPHTENGAIYNPITAKYLMEKLLNYCTVVC